MFTEICIGDLIEYKNQGYVVLGNTKANESGIVKLTLLKTNRADEWVDKNMKTMVTP